MMDKVLLALLVVSAMSFNIGQSTNTTNPCQKFIEDYIKNITTGKLSHLSTIVYSGFTTNNPGQYKECLDTNYSYFLIYFNNVSEVFRTYTTTCLPTVCNQENLQTALKSYNVTVYGYPKQHQVDGLAITGLVVISLWSAVLIVWSCIISFKEEQVKELVKKNDGERNSINSELAEPMLEPVDEVVQEFKLFVFYDGYQELFKAPSKISIFSPIIFFAVLSYLLSVEFSYRLSIAENEKTSAQDLLNSFWGVLACNTEIALHTIMFILGLRLAYGIYKINSTKQILRFFFDQVLKKWVLLLVMTLLIYSFTIVFTGEPLNKVWNLNNGQDCPSYMWQIWFLFRNMQVDCKACLPWMSLIASDVFFTLAATPLVLIFKSNKRLGYGIFSLIVLLSIFISYGILEGGNIVYEPYKLMNGQKQYVLNYQANTFVRMGAYFFGLIFGLFIIEGLEKTESQLTKCFEAEIAKKIRRTEATQILLQAIGFILMLTNFLLIIPYLSYDNDEKKPYSYLVLVPFFFIVGLAIFILSSFWEGEGFVTRLINRVLGWRKWVHLDRISMTFYMIGPMMMAYTNYNMQSNIYFDFTTVATYALGDLVLSYLASLVIASAFESQINTLSSWLQYKVYGNQSKYSVLVIEQPSG